MSLSRFLSFVALKPDEAASTANGWSNRDMDPVPVHLRNWTAWSYITYWITTAVNIPVWEVAGSLLAIGLSWHQALPCIAVGYCMTSVLMVFNGTIGARLHVASSVLNRSSFGFWFSYFSVLCRVTLSMLWCGIQTYNGSQCIYQMIKAIWPSIARMPNKIPPSAGITSSGFLCYFIYWLIQFPFLLLSPQKVKRLFHVKSVIVPITWIAMVIWAFIRVPPSNGLFAEHAAVTGTKFSWYWLSALNSVLGLEAALTVNIADFTRYARNEKAQLVQPLVIPVLFVLCSFAGIAVTNAGIQLYGEVIWDPLLLIDRWDNRAAAFFASLSFSLATVGTNISANTLGAGNDLTALLPKYINIRRGQIICAVIGGWVFVPWKILADAPGFLTFISGCTIFLGPFVGIMVTDFWLVHRGKVDVPAMYDPNGRYRYTKGVNWRAVLALLATVGPTFPGLINTINPAIKVGYATRLFDVSFIYGFVVASVVYYVTSALFPARETFVEKLILAEDTALDHVHSDNLPIDMSEGKADAKDNGKEL